MSLNILSKRLSIFAFIGSVGAIGYTSYSNTKWSKKLNENNNKFNKTKSEYQNKIGDLQRELDLTKQQKLHNSQIIRNKNNINKQESYSSIIKQISPSIVNLFIDSVQEMDLIDSGWTQLRTRVKVPQKLMGTGMRTIFHENSQKKCIIFLGFTIFYSFSYLAQIYTQHLQ